MIIAHKDKLRIRKGLLSGSCKPALQKYLDQFALLTLKRTAQYFKRTLHKPQVIQDQNHIDDL